MSDPAPDGRRGRVPAGCVFSMRATARSFSTLPEDHGNSSVGSYTHGLASLEEVAAHEDVAALLESGRVTPDTVGSIPALSRRPGAVTHGLLTELAEGFEPGVILPRVNGRQLMVLADALPISPSRAGRSAASWPSPPSTTAAQRVSGARSPAHARGCGRTR